MTLDGVRIGLTGATYDETPRTSSPEDLQFLPTVATVERAGRGAAPRGRRFRRRGRACRAQAGLRAVRDARRRSRSSPATTTICSSTTTAATRWSSRATTRTTSPRSTSPSSVKEQDGRRSVDLVAAVPRHRHRDRDARPGGGGGGGEVRGGIHAARWTCRSAPPRSSSTAATPPCARARPRSAT